VQVANIKLLQLKTWQVLASEKQMPDLLETLIVGNIRCRVRRQMHYPAL
jgi:hypothetical protein